MSCERKQDHTRAKRRRRRYAPYQPVDDLVHDPILEHLQLAFPNVDIRQRQITLRREGEPRTTRLLKIAAFVPDSHWIVVETSGWPTTLTSEAEFRQRAQDIFDAANNTQPRRVVILKLHVDDCNSVAGAEEVKHRGGNDTRDTDSDSESDSETGGGRAGSEREHDDDSFQSGSARPQGRHEKSSDSKSMSLDERLAVLSKRFAYFQEHAPPQPLHCEFWFYPEAREAAGESVELAAWQLERWGFRQAQQIGNDRWRS